MSEAFNYLSKSCAKKCELISHQWNYSIHKTFKDIIELYINWLKEVHGDFEFSDGTIDLQKPKKGLMLWRLNNKFLIDSKVYKSDCEDNFFTANAVTITENCDETISVSHFCIIKEQGYHANALLPSIIDKLCSNLNLTMSTVSFIEQNGDCTELLERVKETTRDKAVVFFDVPLNYEIVKAVREIFAPYHVELFFYRPIVFAEDPAAFSRISKVRKLFQEAADNFLNELFVLNNEQIAIREYQVEKSGIHIFFPHNRNNNRRLLYENIRGRLVRKVLDSKSVHKFEHLVLDSISRNTDFSSRVRRPIRSIMTEQYATFKDSTYDELIEEQHDIIESQLVKMEEYKNENNSLKVKLKLSEDNRERKFLDPLEERIKQFSFFINAIDGKRDSVALFGEFINQYFGDSIEFHPRAKNHKEFPRLGNPQFIQAFLEVFRSLLIVLRNRKHLKGDNIIELLTQCGLDTSAESCSTIDKYGDERNFQTNSQGWVFECKHMKWDIGEHKLRLYYDYDNKASKLHVYYLGKHLKTSSGK